MARRKQSRSYTAEEIVEMVQAKFDSTAVQELAKQMEDDFDLLALKPYVAEEGHQAYTSPAPRNDFSKTAHMTDNAPVVWSVEVADDADKKERDAANKAEALIAGVLDRADRHLRDKGEPRLKTSLGWYALARGVAGLRCVFFTNENKETDHMIGPIDGLHVAVEQGSERLVWAAYRYNVSAAEARDRWDIDVGKDSAGKDATATVFDFYDTKINAVVLVSGATKDATKQFVKDPAPHGLDHVPVWVGWVGGMPTVYRRDGSLTLKERATSVFASSRQVYDKMNEQVSFVMDVAQKSVAGTLVYQSPMGEPWKQGDPFGAWKVVNIKDDASLKELVPPQVPQASSMVLGVLAKDKEASTVPYPLGYGIDPGAHSGSALAIMNEGLKSNYSPYTSLIAEAYRWLCTEILVQFKAKGQKMKLQGYDKLGKFFRSEISPDELPKDWYIKVTCEPQLPRDEAADLQMALAATADRPGVGPLLSMQTGRADIVRVKNPDAEAKRVQDERVQAMIDHNPNIQMRRVAQALLDDGRRDEAEELLAQLPNAGGNAPPAAPNGNGGPPQAPPQGQLPPPGGMAPAAGAPPPEAMRQFMLQVVRVAQRMGVSPQQLAGMTREQVGQMMQQAQARGMMG